MITPSLFLNFYIERVGEVFYLNSKIIIFGIRKIKSIKMKKYFLLFLSVFSVSLFAQNTDTIITTSKINKVTVFFSGAQTSRQVEFKANKGTQLLLIDGLPLEVEKQSLRVGEIKDAKTISVKLEKGSSKNPKYKNQKKQLLDQKKEIERKIKYTQTEKGVYDSEEVFIIKNRELAGNSGVTIAQISEGAAYYRSKLTEIRTKKLELDFELEGFKEQLIELDKQMQKLTTSRTKESTHLYVLIDSKTTHPQTTFEISYYLKTAAWEPEYDFRVDQTGQPLVIDYNASIYQTTGEDWKKVKLTLSTSNPSLSSAKPVLNDWYIDKRKRREKPTITSKEKNATLKGKLLDGESYEPVPFANIVVESEGITIGGTSSDFDGNYTIKPIAPGIYDVKATSVGYRPVMMEGIEIKAHKIMFMDIEMMPSDVVMEEYSVTEYKVPLIDKDKTTTGVTLTSDEISRMPNRNAGSVATTVGGTFSSDGYADRNGYLGNVKIIGSSRRGGYSQEAKLYNPSGIINSNYMIEETSKNISDIEYEIKEAFTVLSDGKDYTLKIKESSVPVEYVYFAIPKLDQDAFLTARIADWNQLDLLSGKSSVYYQGTFTGEGYMDDKRTGDTLDLSLGRDRDIVVTRKGNKERLERKVMGKFVKETLSWDIEIKNNKNEKINLILEDQFPLAEQQSIEIELLEISGAKADEKTGKLSWNLQLDANSKKTIQLTYSIKYPNYTKLYLD